MRREPPEAGDPAVPAAPGGAAASATALLALWNDVAPECEGSYNAWHAEEHVPERLTVPGMLWAQRLANPAACGRDAAAPRYLTLYGLRDAAVLESEPYQRLLREPTPMSRTMRPALRHVSRWVCRVAQGAAAPAAPWVLVEALAAEPAEGAERRGAGGQDGAARLSVLTSLRAVRLDAAAPLPWLASGQEGGVQGRVLRCTWCGAEPAAQQAPPGSVAYRRLALAA